MAGNVYTKFLCSMGVALCLGLVALAGMPGLSEASIRFSDDLAASSTYGPSGGDRLGQLAERVGDLNGDGADDFVIAMSNAANGGLWVLYGPLRLNMVDFSDLDPTQGFRITATNTAAGYAAPAGDQNGDGLDDVVVRTFSGAAVIYGASDPSSLAKCDPMGSVSTRCVAMGDPRTEGGSRLGLVLQLDASIFASQWFGADLEGDGEPEMVLFPHSDGVTILKERLEDLCPSGPATCAVSVDDLDSSAAKTISGPLPSLTFGDSVVNLGDTNGDGRDDLATLSGTDGARPPGAWVIYGQDWDSLPTTVADLPAGSGFEVPLPFSVALSKTMRGGDINGDGLADLALSTLKLVPQSADLFVVFGRKGTPDETVSVSPAVAGISSHVAVDPAFGLNINYLKPAGDLNGDGGSELVVGSAFAKVDNVNGVGAISILNSGVLSTQADIDLGFDTSADVAVAFVGEGAGQQFGTGLTSAGDADGDGTPDLLVGIPAKAGSAGANAGELAVLAASAAYPAAGTSIAGSVGMTSADLSGVANANRRESNAYFEYGTTTDYGEETALEAVGHAGVGRGFDAQVSGLQPYTEYHYRAVIENDLGVKSYGQDRSFRTAAKPVDPCDADNTQPGCPGWDVKEEVRKFCKANPTDPVCGSTVGPEGARLSRLIASSRSAKVRRGRKAVVRAWITNTGTKSAGGVKVCVRVPKRLAKVSGKRCQKIGSLAPGKSGKATLKIKVKRKARKGAKVKVKLVASAKGVGNRRTAKVRFAVR